MHEGNPPGHRETGEQLEIGGNSLAVQWLGLRAFTAEGTGSIPGRGVKIPQAVQHSQK